MRDTSKAVAEAQIAVYWNLSGAARLAVAFEMS
jgi:hypothetical protein